MTKHSGTGNVKCSHAETGSGQSTVYQIRVEGHLDDQWTDWFGNMTITLEENGDTLLAGPIVDQAALFGLLKKVRDLGLPLVSITQVEPRPERSRGACKPDMSSASLEKEKT